MEVKERQENLREEEDKDLTHRTHDECFAILLVQRQETDNCKGVVLRV